MSDSIYSFAAPRQQLFAFPSDAISSILDNPSSPKGLLKLYQTCKYFYSQRPILIVDKIEFSAEENDEDEEQGNPLFEANIFLNKKWQNVAHLQTPIWLINEVNFECYSNQQLPKFYRCSAEKIHLDPAELKFEDFLVLTAEKKVHYFYVDIHSNVCHSDGSKATIDQILQHLPNIRNFTYILDENCSAETLAKLNELNFNNKFKHFELTILDVHETFDLNLFCDFITKNSNVGTILSFFICAESQAKLKLIIEKMDPKWKTEAHPGLKELFESINQTEEAVSRWNFFY